MATPITPRTSQPAGDLTDRTLAGRYRIARAIASGGMATVWEATDQLLARKVAVKVLHPHLTRDDAFVRRFRGEAIAAARLAHPSIVSVYDTVSDGGLEAIVMELVSGTTLRADLDNHGPLKLAAVLAIGSQVADALGAAHASGLVHRDVKPANILLSADGRVLVADFGIAKAAAGSDLTSDGSMVGTAKYLAPEQVQGGPVDARTDVYALGIVLYESLCGNVPFQGENDTATALARLHRDPPPLRLLRPDVPPAVEAVVAQALSRDPAHRFQSAAALRTALLSAGADPAAASAAARAAVAAAAVGPATPAPAPAHRPAPAVEPAGPAGPISDSVAVSTESQRDTYDRPHRRGWIEPVLLVLALLAVAGTVTWVAATREKTVAGAAVPIEAFNTFDPLGDNNSEKDDLLPNLTDADPASGWRTENYGADGIAATKEGVGLIVTLRSEAARLRTLEVTTPTGGWSARVYTVGGDIPFDLAGWGSPVGDLNPQGAGTVSVDLRGRPGRRILIWFTATTSEGTAQVNHVEVRAR